MFTSNVEDHEARVVLIVGDIERLRQARDFGIGDIVSIEDVEKEEEGNNGHECHVESLCQSLLQTYDFIFVEMCQLVRKREFRNRVDDLLEGLDIWLG
jgi:hypothetical protein